MHFFALFVVCALILCFVAVAVVEFNMTWSICLSFFYPALFGKVKRKVLQYFRRRKSEEESAGTGEMLDQVSPPALSLSLSL